MKGAGTAAAPPAAATVEDVEVALLLEGVYRHYGYDFRDYALPSIRRRVKQAMQDEGLATISALQDRVLHDPRALNRLVLAVSVHVTSMFRDPQFYKALRERVVPLLRTYPKVRVWHAGCASGEEVYSFAIVLEEEGLYERCRIYATDMNAASVERAKTGIYPVEQVKEFTTNYLAAGGREPFSSYYTANYGHATFKQSLRKNILFAQHNLATDGSFNEFNVILCRNVMIYFNQTLQERTHQLFYNSLGMFGILGLGSRESLRFMPHEPFYEPLVESEKLYRRIA